MLDWYNSIYNKIKDFPTSTRTTSTTFYEYVDNVDDVDSPNIEKQLFAKTDTHQTLKSTDLKCRRCFNWGGGIARQGLCLLTKEKKSHVDNCIDYHDTAGGAYAHSRRH